MREKVLREHGVDKVNQHKHEFALLRKIKSIALSSGYLEGQFGRELVQGHGNGEFQYATDCDFHQKGTLNTTSAFGSRVQSHVRQSKANCTERNKTCPRQKRSREDKQAAAGCIQEACDCTHEALSEQPFGEVFAQAVEAVKDVADLAANKAHEASRTNLSGKNLGGAAVLTNQKNARHPAHPDAPFDDPNSVTLVLAASEKHGQR